MAGERIVIVIDLGQCDAERAADVQAEVERMRAEKPPEHPGEIHMKRGKDAHRVMQAVRALW